MTRILPALVARAHGARRTPCGRTPTRAPAGRRARRTPSRGARATSRCRTAEAVEAKWGGGKGGVGRGPPPPPGKARVLRGDGRAGAGPGRPSREPGFESPSAGPAGSARAEPVGGGFGPAPSAPSSLSLSLSLSPFLSLSLWGDGDRGRQAMTQQCWFSSTCVYQSEVARMSCTRLMPSTPLTSCMTARTSASFGACPSLRSVRYSFSCSNSSIWLWSVSYLSNISWILARFLT
mmetsp:Transcript_59725/g.124782  ORF Transcript_59725/g.124782 Transcript_59725/m.124782 type:complete len:235 (+) Transcript_59725:309-1013(+)